MTADPLAAMRDRIYTLLNREEEFVGCPSATTDQIMRIISDTIPGAVETVQGAPKDPLVQAILDGLVELHHDDIDPRRHTGAYEELRDDAQHLAARVRAALTADDQELRDRIAQTLRTTMDHHIIAEWICCDPVNPDHDLCRQGDATRDMVRALLTDDPQAHPERSAVLDAVMEVVAADRAALEQEVARLRDVERNLESAIWVDPDRMGGTACVGGTRVPTRTIAQLMHGGEVTPEQVAHYYPSVTPEGARAAQWFEGRYTDQVAEAYEAAHENGDHVSSHDKEQLADTITSGPYEDMINAATRALADLEPPRGEGDGVDPITRAKTAIGAAWPVIAKDVEIRDAGIAKLEDALAHAQSFAWQTPNGSVVRATHIVDGRGDDWVVDLDDQCVAVGLTRTAALARAQQLAEEA